ncbi:hypothetical protein H312_00905 [Anncaliia algerae PRA339]|uniref:60S ribosomal protein L37 n=1 Tax=Anncaliia algerae PRA339 TaxID=1288291 RepID=A0A059F443_9MICR|nr:hypothetical protein H312_00905 [Anncaliia algerae PRA339]
MSYHKQKKTCSSCGYPEKKLRNPGSIKAVRRNTTGTGRCRHLKKLARARRSGFKGNAIIYKLKSQKD